VLVAAWIEQVEVYYRNAAGFGPAGTANNE
jgi:hypothetical protein